MSGRGGGNTKSTNGKITSLGRAEEGEGGRGMKGAFGNIIYEHTSEVE